MFPPRARSSRGTPSTSRNRGDHELQRHLRPAELCCHQSESAEPAVRHAKTDTVRGFPRCRQANPPGNPPQSWLSASCMVHRFHRSGKFRGCNPAASLFSGYLVPPSTACLQDQKHLSCQSVTCTCPPPVVVPATNLVERHCGRIHGQRRIVDDRDRHDAVLGRSRHRRSQQRVQGTAKYLHLRSSVAKEAS